MRKDIITLRSLLKKCLRIAPEKAAAHWAAYAKSLERLIK
jgi:hypothetical protein